MKFNKGISFQLASAIKAQANYHATKENTNTHHSVKL
jgi:hypothetical protein